MTTSRVDLSKNMSNAGESMHPEGIEHHLRKRETASKTANTIVSLVQQLNKGVPPSNSQLFNFLDHTSEGLERAEGDAKLNKKGKRFIKESEGMVASTRKLISEKNNDELAQALLIDMAAASVAAKKHTENNVVDARDMRMNKAIMWRTGRACFNIFSLVYASEAFKEMLFCVLDATDQALAPTLSQPDQATQEGRPSGEDARPEAARSETDTRAREDNQGKETVQRGENQNSIFRPLIKSYRSNNKKSSTLLVRENMEKLRQSVILFLRGDMSNVDSQTTENIRYHFDQFLREISENDQYHNSVNDIFGLLETAKLDALFSAHRVSDMRKSAQDDRSIVKVRRETRYMLERFVDKNTLKSLSASLRTLMEQMTNDQQILEFLPSVSRSFKNVANSPELLNDEATRSELRRHVDTSREFYKRYSNDEQVVRFTNEFGNMLGQISRDALLLDWYRSALRLSRSLTYTDSYGKMRIETDILKQMKQILIALVAEQLKYVAIPTISGSDKRMDWTLSQVIFSGYDLLPERFRVRTNLRWNTDVKGPIVRSSLHAATGESGDSASGSSRREGRRHRVSSFQPMNFSRRDPASDSGQNGGVLIFDIEQVRANIQDAAFIYRRKVFPYMVDQGLASVALRGKGATIRILLDFNTSDSESLLFTGGSVRVLIDSLKMRVIQSKHDRLYGVLFTLFNTAIRKQVEYQLSQKISSVIGSGIGNVNRRYSKIPKSNVRKALLNAIGSTL